MKRLLVALYILSLSNYASAICFNPIARTNINPGEIPTSARYNSDMDNLYARANELPGNCLLDTSLTGSQLQDSSIGNDQIADATLTAAKFANGVLPAIGRLLRVKVFTASGDWSKQADTEYILIHVVGGGGGTGYNGYNGGASSFGTHCTAYGGRGCSSSPAPGSCASGAPGGYSTGGDINLDGESGELSVGASNIINNPGLGGHTFFGRYGRGGTNERPGVGGGAGGYCIKLIQKTSLADSVRATVGAGGSILSGFHGKQGESGIILIYEYGR